MGRGAWRATVDGVAGVRHDWATRPPAFLVWSCSPGVSFVVSVYAVAGTALSPTLTVGTLAADPMSLRGFHLTASTDPLTGPRIPVFMGRTLWAIGAVQTLAWPSSPCVCPQTL